MGFGPRPGRSGLSGGGRQLRAGPAAQRQRPGTFPAAPHTKRPKAAVPRPTRGGRREARGASRAAAGGCGASRRRKRADVGSRLRGYPKMAKTQTAREPGVRCCRQSAAPPRLSNSADGWVFPGGLFLSLGKRLLGALAAVLGRWVRARPCGKGPPGRAGKHSGLRPLGSRRRIVSFQSENLQALGNDIQKSI